jgi:oligopeptidase B
VYRNDFNRDGSHPMLLTGYGAYGYTYPVNFSSNILSLLDRGFVFAIAHIRGGGDLGKVWHDQGRMMNKTNTFTDFIVAADHLVNERYTSSGRLIATGTSAGGLLMGAIANMRPDLFKAVIARVPFLDVINTMLDESLPLTVPEYEEWGNPKEKAAYDYMLSYSPYDQLEAKSYPALLVKTSFNDSQVMYWEPAKYVAKLRTMKTDTNPLLLKTNMAAGHGGASGRYDLLRETAFEYAFMLWQVGKA